MKNKENELFLDLCDFLNDKSDQFKKMVSENFSTEVLGSLFESRMSAVAYDVLRKNDLLGCVSRESRNALKSAYLFNSQFNVSFANAVDYLNVILGKHIDKYAMLKGAVLCSAYPEGYRTSNDVDLLIRPNDVSTIGKVLSLNGFIQGYIQNDLFVPATRKEIVSSKMTRGETVPYIKEINLPNMKYLEVDLNFSIDYKNTEDNVVAMMLDNSEEVRINGRRIKTLSLTDFFIHLCQHLYKEATTYPWVKMKRDMTLYKFSDIFFMLNTYCLDAYSLFERAKDLKLDHVVACVILWTNDLFRINNETFMNVSKSILNKRDDLLMTVFSPEEKIEYSYVTTNAKDRFFSDCRESLLYVKKKG